MLALTFLLAGVGQHGGVVESVLVAMPDHGGGASRGKRQRPAAENALGPLGKEREAGIFREASLLAQDSLSDAPQVRILDKDGEVMHSGPAQFKAGSSDDLRPLSPSDAEFELREQKDLGDTHSSSPEGVHFMEQMFDDEHITGIDDDHGERMDFLTSLVEYFMKPSETQRCARLFFCFESNKERADASLHLSFLSMFSHSLPSLF